MQITMPYDSIVNGLRQADEESQREFIKRFGSRIEAWARKRLPPAYQIHLDPAEPRQHGVPDSNGPLPLRRELPDARRG